MQFRLRTLLIAVTLACMFFAWAAYLRRKAAHHRQQAASLILRISETDHLKHQKIEEAVHWLAAGTAKVIRGYDYKSRNTIVSFRGQPPFFLSDEEGLKSAVYHQKMAAAYDGAMLRPWTLLSAKPAP
jgi:hypothetical protein